MMTTQRCIVITGIWAASVIYRHVLMPVRAVGQDCPTRKTRWRPAHVSLRARLALPRVGPERSGEVAGRGSRTHAGIA